MASDAAAPTEPAASSPEGLGLLELIRSDHEAYARLRKRRSRPVVRLLLDPSLHATTLIRICASCPRWMHWFWRTVTIWKHSIDCGKGARIGPGLYLPHPFGIVIAPQATVGADVQIFHNVTLGGSLRTPGVATICDGVTLLPNCTVSGPVTVGQGAIVGNGALVDRDVPAVAAFGP